MTSNGVGAPTQPPSAIVGATAAAATAVPTLIATLLEADEIGTPDSTVADNYLSEAQEKALAWIPVITGLLSTWGSANIIYAVYKTDKRSRNCYNRIMFGLSFSDVVSSLVLSLQAFLLPKETSHRVYASGNDATCAVMGFFQQLSLSSIFYSGMLSFMYLLTINYSVPEARLAKRYEPWFHILSIGFPVITGIIGGIMGLYGELAVGAFCWFAGSESTLFAYIVGGIPGFIIMFAVIINNLRVYCHVRRSIRNTNQERSASDNFFRERFRSLAPPPTGSETSDGSGVGPRQLSIESGKSKKSDESHESNISRFSNEHGTDMRALRDLQREEQRLRSLQDRSKARVQAVARQACYYVAGFVLCYLPTFVIRVTAATLALNPNEEARLFPLLVIQAIFWPLQGLFNFLIYSRSPSYLREIEGE